ncbi:hypothetical protein [Methylocystis hirsuta]|uniref:Porin n=1 Tax=Methylocystis hirsuta TaxID=369798 RepID=A0A3M9XLB7_9HYPH|nr:hypothetical protein [Methylocystis hirsuta]RNJ48595.1 hypothetical protein D1O30_02085 [Methylocystis hirsuta]
MTNRRPCVNGILAAVLSASVIPLHGALAQEKTPTAQRPAVRLPASLPVKNEVSVGEAIKSEEKEAADGE